MASWNGLLSNPFEIEVVPPVEGKRYRMEALLADGTPAKDSTIPTSSMVTFVLRNEEGEGYSLAFDPEKGGSFSLFIGFTFARKEFPVHVMPAQAELTLEIDGMEVYPSGEMLYTAGKSGQISNPPLAIAPSTATSLTTTSSTSSSRGRTSSASREGRLPSSPRGR